MQGILTAWKVSVTIFELDHYKNVYCIMSVLSDSIPCGIHADSQPAKLTSHSDRCYISFLSLCRAGLNCHAKNTDRSAGPSICDLFAVAQDLIYSSRMYCDPQILYLIKYFMQTSSVSPATTLVL